MSNKNWFVLLVVFLAAGIVFFLLPSDEKKIRNNLISLAEYCSSVTDEPAMETLKKTAFATKLFLDPCWIQIESFTIDRGFSQKEISDHLLMMKKRLSATRFSFHDTAVNISTDNGAEILTTLRLNGKTVDGQFTDAYELNIAMEKNDGKWFFASFTVVEFIEQ